MGENQQRIVRAAARDAFLRFGEGGLISGAAVLEFVEGSTYAEACHQHEFEHAWAEADRHQRGRGRELRTANERGDGQDCAGADGRTCH